MTARPAVRNHIARALWQPRFKPQQVQDKRRKQADRKPTKAALRNTAHA